MSDIYKRLRNQVISTTGCKVSDEAISIILAWQAARAQGGEGVEPVGFIPSSGLNNLAAGHPAKMYPVGATPSPFESHEMLYTQRAQQGVPEGLDSDRAMNAQLNGELRSKQ